MDFFPMKRLFLLLALCIPATGMAQFTGGNNDGFSAGAATAQNPLPGIFKGGADDGSASGAAASQHPLTNIYAGGANDGFALAAATSQNALNGIYYGGQNDGFAAFISPAQNPLTAFYKGGGDDGVSSIQATGQNNLTSIYSGGLNDGAATTNTSLTNPLSAIYHGAGNDGSAIAIKLTQNPFVPLYGPFIAVTAGLQGDMGPSGIMRSDLQNYFGGNTGLLPLNDPYGLGQHYAQINNPSGPAGAVVDWIKVELRSSANPATVHQTRALLFRPDGSIVDSTGEIPKFNPQAAGIRLAVFQRNHVAVLSNAMPPASQVSALSYNFTTSLLQAANPFSDPPQMVLVNGKWCLWAGDVNTPQDLFVDNSDLLFTRTAYLLSPFDVYDLADLNLDGFIDNTDFLLQRINYQLSLYSALSNY